MVVLGGYKALIVFSVRWLFFNATWLDLLNTIKLNLLLNLVFFFKKKGNIILYSKIKCLKNVLL